MAGTSPHPPPPSPPPDAQELPPESWPSADADQEIDIAGSEADEPPIGEAVEDDRRRPSVADDPTATRSSR